MLQFNAQPLPITHLAVLIDWVRRTNGNVLELGIGWGSTIALHELCRGRKLMSYDNEPKFIEGFSGLRSDWHEINLVDDWSKVPIEDNWWEVAFVDHAPCIRRREDIVRLVNHADYVIVHDTEREVDRFYRYRRAFNLYKYRKDYTLYKPYTTVLSNFHAL